MHVGFLGIGTMGAPMSRNLLPAVDALVVWNRSPGRTDEIASLGATAAASPTEVFEECDVVFAMMATEAALDETLDRRGDTFGVDVRGSILVNVATTTTAYSAALSDAIGAAGGRFVESPVSGSKVPAEQGTLLAMVAGDDEDIEVVRPMLDAMCGSIVVCGRPPAATAMKLANNVYLVTSITGLVEAFEFADRAGLDPALLAEVISGGQLGSDIARLKSQMLSVGDTSPQAGLANVVEVLETIRRSGDEIGASLPMLDTSLMLFRRARDAGHGEEDMVAVRYAYEGA